MNLTKIIDWTLLLIVFFGIIYVRTEGYYQSIYVEMKQCDDIIYFEKISKQEFNNRMETVKQTYNWKENEIDTLKEDLWKQKTQAIQLNLS